MKVKIDMIVDIDQEAWEAQFDVSPIRATTQSGKVRTDVREYARSTVLGQLEAIGVLK